MNYFYNVMKAEDNKYISYNRGVNVNMENNDENKDPNKIKSQNNQEPGNNGDNIKNADKSSSDSDSNPSEDRTTPEYRRLIREWRTALNVQQPIEPDDDNNDEGGPGYSERRRDPHSRYKYKRVQNKSNIQKIIVLIIIIITILAFVFYGFPSWHAYISLQEQLYANKAGGLPFWHFYVLNYWSTSFIINKIGFIGAIMGCIIMSLPPEKNLIAAIGVRYGWGRPSNKKALVVWWTLGFVFFYFLAQMIEAGSFFAFTSYWIEQTDNEFNAGLILLPFAVIFRADYTMYDVFQYSNLILPWEIYILVVLILRQLLNIIGITYLRRNDYLLAKYISNILAISFVMGIVSIPMYAFDNLGFIQIFSLFIALFGTIGFSIYMNQMYKRHKTKKYLISESEIKRFGMAIAIIIGLILIPFIISIPISIGIDSNYNNWLNNRWEIQTKKQIEWTRQAGGLDIFEERDINDLINSKQVNDSEIISTIRQYDKGAALSLMSNIFQSPFESLADSDIVYINNSEYWLAPKTLKISHIAQTTERKHTNLFDHVEGFIAIDTTSGEFLTNTQISERFGVNASYPIFFGEHESSELIKFQQTSGSDEEYIDIFGEMNPLYGAFDDDILLNTGWGLNEQSENYQFLYNGTPDGSLDGLEAFWFTSGMGLLSYALDSSMKKEFLINRNIMTRVNNILLPGLWIDNDPYLVIDPYNHKLYYALSINTNIPMSSYSNSNILRFIGVTLVDVLDGSMDFYLNPMWENTTRLQNDPLYDIWKIYLQKYHWKNAEPWLEKQLRYPEQLIEKQLELYYKYHINDPDLWKSGSQFHERPPNGDLFYVEFDLGEGLEYVGVDLVQRTTSSSSSSTTLAGLYVIRQGDNFGQCVFYRAPTTGTKRMISPSTAESSYENNAKDILTLKKPYEYGNILLYPLNDSLYFFIPTYTITSNLKALSYSGFVDAFDYLAIGHGDNATEAYKNLPFYKEEIIPPEVPILANNTANITLDYRIENLNETLDISTLYLNLKISKNETYTAQNIVVNLTVYSNTINVSKFGNELDGADFTWSANEQSFSGKNYTVIEKSLYPSEGYSVSVDMTSNLGSEASKSFWARLIVLADGKIVETSEIFEITIYNPNAPS